MWIFTGKYFWRIGKGPSGNDIPEQPVESKSFWFGLPRSVLEDENLTIDAVYERSDHKIVFFIGREYYVLAGNTHLDEGPMQISQLGLSFRCFFSIRYSAAELSICVRRRTYIGRTVQ